MGERPITRVNGGSVHNRSGTYVGRLNGKYPFSRSRQYLATLEGERLVYRSKTSWSAKRWRGRGSSGRSGARHETLPRRTQRTLAVKVVGQL